MLMEFLMFSHYTYALPIWDPAISRDCLSRLDRLQNRAVHLTCGLRKYDHVSRCRAGLGWLSLYNVYRSVLAILGQHYLGVAFSPPITFGKRPPWFTDIFQYKKFSVNVFPTPGYYIHGGILYCLIYFMI